MITIQAMTTVQIMNVFTRLINNAAYSSALRKVFMTSYPMANIDDFDTFLASIAPANLAALLADNRIGFIRDDYGYFAFHARADVTVVGLI